MEIYIHFCIEEKSYVAFIKVTFRRVIEVKLFKKEAIHLVEIPVEKTKTSTISDEFRCWIRKLKHRLIKNRRKKKR